MSFNYLFKKETYEKTLALLKNELSLNNINGALLYIDQVINLARELSINSSIEEIKKKYRSEYNSLVSLKEKLSRDINPFSSQNRGENHVHNGYSQDEESSSKSKYFSDEVPSVKLEDIAGLEEVKQEITLNVIVPLKKPELFYKYCDNLGARILMYGPPGCGKSFVAEAIAGELQCKYCAINAGDILDKYVGEAPKKIKEIFKEADTYENCLIFIDELDSLFASRESDDSAHTKDILTTFLTCLSGFGANGKTKKIKVVIGATNRPWALDSALLRGKRFDTQLYVGLPDYDAREFMIKKALKSHMELLNGSDITIEDMANKLEGYSGADITSIIDKLQKNTLAKALRNNSEKDEIITLEDFETVVSKNRNSITKESIEAFLAFKNGEI